MHTDTKLVTLQNKQTELGQSELIHYYVAAVLTNFCTVVQIVYFLPLKRLLI